MYWFFKYAKDRFMLRGQDTILNYFKKIHNSCRNTIHLDLIVYNECQCDSVTEYLINLLISSFMMKSCTVKVKGCYSRFHLHVLDYCQWLRMPDYLICPRIPHKQIGGITSTSGNFRPYQIQTANIHFKESFPVCKQICLTWHC